MILEILKQYILLVMKLEIMLLVWVQQILNKQIYEVIFLILRKKQNHGILHREN